MSNLNSSYREQYNAKMMEMFPDTNDSRKITRENVVKVMEALGSNKWPHWITRFSVSRGVYSIDGAAAKKVIPMDKPTTNSAPVALVVEQHNAPVTSFIASADDARSLVPSKDDVYVPFGNHKDVESIVKSGIFYPTYITGHSGNGKSYMVNQVCARSKKPFIRINITEATVEEDLIGSKTMVDGTIQIVEGPLLIAMRIGATCLIDEIDAGDPNNIMCLQSILEGKPYYFKLKNEVITPAAGFNVIATGNTKGKGSDNGRYIGTNILNEAFLDRFGATFEQEYPSQAAEKKILTKTMEKLTDVDNEFIETLVKWADSIRRTFNDGGVDEIVTTRRLIHIINGYSVFRDKAQAVTMACNRFDEITKIAFIDLFDKISNEPVQTEENGLESSNNEDSPDFIA